MKLACVLALLGPTLVLAQPNQGGGPFPGAVGANSNSLSGSFIAINKGIGTNNQLYSPTNWFRIQSDGTTTSTNREPFWVDNGAAAGHQYFLMVPNGGSKHIFDIRTQASPNQGVYVGDAGFTDGVDFVSLQARSSAGGNTDPRITIVFESVGGGPPESSWVFRETNFNLDLRDPNTFNHVTYPVVTHNGTNVMPTFIAIGSSMLDTSITASNGITFNSSNLYQLSQTQPMFTIIGTNFIQGFIYSNAYGAPIQVVANIRLTTAAVAGDATMDLQQPAGTLTNRVGIQTTASSLAITNEVNLVGFIPKNGTYAITNTITTGSGNAVIVIGGQIFVY